jgi:hypothetical protein
MARTVLEDVLPTTTANSNSSKSPTRKSPRNKNKGNNNNTPSGSSHSGVVAGCCMPAALVGGDGPVLSNLLKRMKDTGIDVTVDLLPVAMWTR